jgi:hypothetical protein
MTSRFDFVTLLDVRPLLVVCSATFQRPKLFLAIGFGDFDVDPGMTSIASASLSTAIVAIH